MQSLSKGLILLTFSACSLVFAESQTVQIDGMTCNACVKSVKKSVCEGPLKATLKKCDVKIGSVTVEGDQIDLVAVKKAVTDAGFQPK